MINFQASHKSYAVSGGKSSGIYPKESIVNCILIKKRIKFLWVFKDLCLLTETSFYSGVCLERNLFRDQRKSNTRFCKGRSFLLVCTSSPHCTSLECHEPLCEEKLSGTRYK